jgi:hypothetical protein
VHNRKKLPRATVWAAKPAKSAFEPTRIVLTNLFVLSEKSDGINQVITNLSDCFSPPILFFHFFAGGSV